MDLELYTKTLSILCMHIGIVLIVAQFVNSLLPWRSELPTLNLKLCNMKLVDLLLLVFL